MKKQILSIIFLIACSSILLASCSFGNSNTSWAYTFVGWEGNTYQLTSDYVDTVGEELGEITMYSDNEGTYTGTFSNEYEKGTKLYAIPNIPTGDAIAVQEKDGRHRKMAIVPE